MSRPNAQPFDEAAVRPLVEQVVDRYLSKLETGTNGSRSLIPGDRSAVAIGADHGGYALKEILVAHLHSHGYEVRDCGTHSPDPVDYPEIAHAVARLVAGGDCGCGIIVDGAGIGSCMVANKVPGIRAALCYDIPSARNSRAHNHANVLTLGTGLLGRIFATQIVDVFLATPWAPGRHARRVAQIEAIGAAPGCEAVPDSRRPTAD